MKKIIASLIVLILLNILISSSIGNKLTYQNCINIENESNNIILKLSYIDNNPPVIRNPDPENNTIASVSLSKLNIYIEDYEGNEIDWIIETSPDIGKNSGFGETNGTKTCDINGLQYSTTYKWYVNATDPFGSNIHIKKVYVFTTEDESEYIPTIAKINVEVYPRNSLGVDPIGISDVISEWIDFENKVRVEWEFKNPQHYTYNKPNLVIHFRIREFQVYNKWAAFIFLLTESGRIETEGDWEDVVIPIRDESYNGSKNIDVTLLELDDMIMVSWFYLIDSNVKGFVNYDTSTYQINFNDI